MVSVWLQNWVGTQKFMEGVRLLWNWQLNMNQYPDWNELVDYWNKDGVKPMLYMNPYFANVSDVAKVRTDYFNEAVENGYFVMQQDGTPYLTYSGSINFGMIDFTNEAARTWAKSIIKDNLLKEGRSIGWMCDFGEYTPMDAKFKNWDDFSQNYHNRYPYEWAKLTKEAV